MRQSNGALRDMVCRGLLLMLERAGQITLPAVSYVRHNPLATRVPPERAAIDTAPIEARLRDLQPLQLEPVRRTPHEPLFNSLMEAHHYLGYEQPVGEHLKYLVWAQGRPVACLAFFSAPRHLGSRDRYIGWSAEARRRNPFPRLQHAVPDPALGAGGTSGFAYSGSDGGADFRDWQRMYGHPIYFLERSSIRSDSVARVIGRRTGYCWARPRDEGSNRTAMCRTAPSEGQLGIPLPAATQWEIVEEAAEAIKPAQEELIRQAAQGRSAA